VHLSKKKGKKQEEKLELPKEKKGRREETRLFRGNSLPPEKRRGSGEIRGEG